MQQVELPLPQLNEATSAPHLTGGDVQADVTHDNEVVGAQGEG